MMSELNSFVTVKKQQLKAAKLFQILRFEVTTSSKEAVG
jgi:hypothetical protein